MAAQRVMAKRKGIKPIRYVMAAARPLNSAGQSASLVMRKSAVRIRKGAQTLTLHFGGGFVPIIIIGLFSGKVELGQQYRMPPMELRWFAVSFWPGTCPATRLMLQLTH